MRSYYLTAYDVSDPKRLYRVHRRMQGFGMSLQFSVFLCLLSPKELALLREMVDEEIKKSEDRVMIVNLGPEEGEAEGRIAFIGRREEMPERRAIIV